MYFKDDLSSEVQLHWEGNDLHASIKSTDDIIYIEVGITVFLLIDTSGANAFLK